MGIFEANWLLGEIAYIIKILDHCRYKGCNIISLIRGNTTRLICPVMFNSVIEKYGKFNGLLEIEGEGLFEVLNKESIKLLTSGKSCRGDGKTMNIKIE